MSAARLSKEQQDAILEAYRAGNAIAAIASRFGVSLSYPGLLAKRRNGSVRRDLPAVQPKLQPMSIAVGRSNKTVRGGKPAKPIKSRPTSSSPDVMKPETVAVPAVTSGVHSQAKASDDNGSKAKGRHEAGTAVTGDVSRQSAGCGSGASFPEPRMVALVELTEQTCKWPVAGTGIDARFCGLAVDGAPYCRYHRSLAYQAPRLRVTA